MKQYEWIATERQYFGQPNTAYDFEANDPREASRRVEKLQQQKVTWQNTSLIVSLELAIVQPLLHVRAASKRWSKEREMM